MALRYITTLLIVVFSNFCIGQDNQKAEDILKRAQTLLEEQPVMSSELEYKFYPTYTHELPSESYRGKIIKNGATQFTKINETIFLTNANHNKLLKLNTAQKLMLLEEDANAETTSSLNLVETFVKLFKTKHVEDKGDYWLCTLTSDVITQLPYGHVEIFVNKNTYQITKQVLYYLSQYPYTSEKGEALMGNPKIEIQVSNYKLNISKDEAIAASFSSYISHNKSIVSPSALYKDFKVIQN